MGSTMKWWLGALLCTGTALVALPSTAATADGRTADGTTVDPLVAETDHMNYSEFDARRRLAANLPNELSRLYGAEAMVKGDWADAMRHFLEAARHADKYSQHRISLLYWHGAGVARDRALAYAWADLAAERMYPQFVLLREKMWLALTAAEQALALSEGAALYDRYGDEVAKPNFARALSRAKRQVTGSRTGFVNHLEAGHPDSQQAGASGGPDLSGLYDGARWDPERYWAIEDAVWRTGHVGVGDLETLPGDAP